MYTRSPSHSPACRIGRAFILSALALAAACGDVTTPTNWNDPESPPGPTPPARVTMPEGGLLMVRGDRILRVEVESTGPREPVVVAENAGLPSLSPDGSMMAFVRNGHPLTGRWTLCVARVDGSEPTCASGDEGSSIYYPASWSPDGGSLAYSIHSDPEGFSGLMVLDVSTMASREVTSFPVISPSWSPEKAKGEIAFVYGSGWEFESDWAGSLGVIAPDGTGFRTVSEGDGRYLFRQVAWSPSGDLLAFNLSDQWNCPMSCLSVLGAGGFDAGSRGEGLDPLVVLDAGIEWDGISWSPDGAGVAFVKGRCRDEGSCEIVWDVMFAGLGGGPAVLLVPDARWPFWGR